MSAKEIHPGKIYAGDRYDTEIRKVTKIDQLGNGKAVVHFVRLKTKKGALNPPKPSRNPLLDFAKWAFRLVDSMSEANI